MTTHSHPADPASHLAELLLDAEPDAILVVAEDGRLKYANAAGLALLERGDILRLDAERVTAADEATAASLAIAVSWVCRDREGHSVPLAETTDTLRITIRSLRTPDAQLAAIRLVDREAHLQAALARAQALYRFSPGERRLAEALMRGMDLAEYAESRSLAMPTVRTQMQKIFAKTGVRRQMVLMEQLYR